MLFPSVIFISLFMPLTVALLALLRGKSVCVRNAALLAMSVLFYAIGGGWYTLLLIGCAFVNYALALAIDARQGRTRTLITAAAVVINIATLGYFKYTGFIVRGVNILFQSSVIVSEIILPLGVSFFTFQALSYTLDVSAGRVKARRNPIDVLLYVCLFPQLVAGPIVKFTEFEPQLTQNKFTSENILIGMRVFAFGLAKKALLADELSKVAALAFDCPPNERTAPLAILGAVCYTMQIYLDFSGYSTMAIGLGKMIGFDFPVNFRTPLAALSMGDFWRRWHITLSEWFREYVYIPLGGNRRGKAATLRNMAIVFALTGIWHGAALTFVIWGLWNGLFVVLERAGFKPSRLPRFVARAYVLVVVALGFVLFRASSLESAAQYYASMASFAPLDFARLSRLLEPLTLKAMFVIVVSAVVCLVSPNARLVELLAARMPRWLPSVAAFVCAVLSYAAIVSSAHHPFIYFRF